MNDKENYYKNNIEYIATQKVKTFGGWDGTIETAINEFIKTEKAKPCGGLFKINSTSITACKSGYMVLVVYTEWVDQNES